MAEPSSPAEMAEMAEMAQGACYVTDRPAGADWRGLAQTGADWRRLARTGARSSALPCTIAG